MGPLREKEGRGGRGGRGWRGQASRPCQASTASVGEGEVGRGGVQEEEQKRCASKCIEDRGSGSHQGAGEEQQLRTLTWGLERMEGKEVDGSGEMGQRLSTAPLRDHSDIGSRGDLRTTGDRSRGSLGAVGGRSVEAWEQWEGGVWNRRSLPSDAGQQSWRRGVRVSPHSASPHRAALSTRCAWDGVCHPRAHTGRGMTRGAYSASAR